MNDNERLFTAYDFLKKIGHIKTYTQLAEVLGTNKAGVNDLKTGKKKVSLDNIRSMIKSYPEISLDWLVMEEGNMEIKERKADHFDISTELLIMQKEKIEDLKRELADLRNSQKEPIFHKSVVNPTSELSKTKK
jgi:plasmid maintenance system antidote protein VapI